MEVLQAIQHLITSLGCTDAADNDDYPVITNMFTLGFVTTTII